MDLAYLHDIKGVRELKKAAIQKLQFKLFNRVKPGSHIPTTCQQAIVVRSSTK
jgi:hypothetical protein